MEDDFRACLAARPGRLVEDQSERTTTFGPCESGAADHWVRGGGGPSPLRKYVLESTPVIASSSRR